MNQHQVLTGAVNPGDYCYSVGSVEGVPFTVSSFGVSSRVRLEHESFRNPERERERERGGVFQMSISSSSYAEIDDYGIAKPLNGTR